MSETPYQTARREKKAYVRLIVSTRFAESAGVRWELEVGTLDPEKARKVIVEVMRIVANP